MDKNYSLNLLKYFIVLQIILVAPTAVRAATITSGLSGSWANPLTWVGGNVPGPADNVVITSNFVVTIVSGSVSCAALTVDHPNSSPGTSNLIIASGATLTVSGATVITGANNANRICQIDVNGTGIFSGAVTLQTGITNNTLFNVSSTGVATINGNITISSATKLELVGTATLNFGGGSFTNSGTYTVSSTATIGYTSASAQSIPAGSYPNLALSGSAKTFPSGTIIIQGSFTPGSSTSANAGTIEFNSIAAQTIPVFGYNNLTISGIRGANNVTLAAGEIGIKGTLTNSATFLTGAFITTGNTISYNGSSSQNIASFNYNHLKINKSAGTASLTQNITASNLAGNLIVELGTLSSAGFSVTGNPSATIQVSSGGILSLSGGSAFPSSFGTESLLGQVTYSGGVLNSTGMTIAAKQYANLTISGSFIVGGNVVFANNANVRISGNFTNSATFTGSAIDFNNATIEFNGSGTQAVSGFVLTTAFGNVLINNSGTGSNDGVRIDDNTMTIAGVLTLDAGQLILNGKILVISNNAPGAIVDAGGVIKSESTDNLSKVQWNIGSTTGSHMIPFGKSASDPIPFTFNLVSGTAGTVSVATYGTAAADNLPYPAGVTDLDRMGSDNSVNVVDRFWQIDAVGSVAPNVTLTFSCTAGEASGISALRAQRWSGVTWDAPIAGQTNPSATSVMVPNVSSFSPWTLSGNNAALPIELLSFKAKRVNKQVELSWTTASEINNDRFEIERISADGKASQPIGNVSGAGNSQVIHPYSFMDKEAPAGAAYYRLKQIDFNGNYTYSDAVAVSAFLKGQLSLMPNPASSATSVVVEAEKDQEVWLQVIDITGREVYSGYTQVDKGLSNLSLEIGNLENGLYMITVHADEQIMQERLMKQ